MTRQARALLLAVATWMAACDYAGVDAHHPRAQAAARACRDGGAVALRVSAGDGPDRDS